MVGRAVNENLKQAFEQTAQLIVMAKNGIYIPVTWCNDVNIDLKEKTHTVAHHALDCDAH